jgi:phosphoglycolate phosphatase-like HAD superfamily hydrolase
MSSPQFRWDSFDAYLFDIDGTLLNSRDGVHYNAFHAALEQAFGVNDKIDSVPVHGNTDPGILRAVVRKAGISEQAFIIGLPRALDYMRRAALQNCADMRPEVCPGVREFLEALRAKNKLLGLVSGNLEAIAWAKLRAAALRNYFAFGSFSDERESRRDIFAHGVAQARQRLGSDTASVCIVGDTPSDVVAARECKLPVIAVATGTYTIDKLRDQSPDLCISCCGDLLKTEIYSPSQAP